MHNRRAFARTELAALTVVGGVVLSLLIVGMHDSRRSAMLGRDLANLRQIGAWTGSYIADNRDLIWSFSWKAGQSHSQWPYLNNATTDVRAAANQAVDNLRRRADRTDILSITGWIANPLYSHLVLAEYADRDLPDQVFVSAGDRHRLNWAKDPAAFDRGEFWPYQPGPTVSSSVKRWPYSASFQLPPAFFDRSDWPLRLSQSSHNSWITPSGHSLGPASLAQVHHPSQKVHMHDAGSWHFGRARYFAVADARATVLMVDGSAGARPTPDSNPGWRPNDPTNAEPTLFAYFPRAWEPPTSDGEPGEVATGHYRWTRGGIEGIDFGGPEINTGQR